MGKAFDAWNADRFAIGVGGLLPGSLGRIRREFGETVFRAEMLGFASEETAARGAAFAAAGAPAAAKFSVFHSAVYECWALSADGYEREAEALAALARAAPELDRLEAARAAFLERACCAVCGEPVIERGLMKADIIWRHPDVDAYFCEACADENYPPVLDAVAESRFRIMRLMNKRAFEAAVARQAVMEAMEEFGLESDMFVDAARMGMRRWSYMLQNGKEAIDN